MRTETHGRRSLSDMIREPGVTFAQGDLEKAQALQEHVLEVRKETIGDKNLQTLQSQNSLALILRAKGNLEEARRLQEQVLKVLRDSLGEEHSYTLGAMD